MRKVFHFDATRERYRADAAVIACFDDRFDAGLRKFLRRSGVLRWDAVRIAGGPRSLGSPACEAERDFVIGQLRASERLHGTRRVILVAHSDCGAYGGLEAFHGDAVNEAEYHCVELSRAAEAVAAALPHLRVDLYYMDFEGVWEPPVSRAQPLSALSTDERS